MATQSITKKNLKLIYDSVCDSWKIKLNEILLWSEGKEVEISEELILKGYSEANADQKKLIEKYFKINTPKSICERIQNWKDILEINEISNFKDLIKNPQTKEEKCLNATNRLFLICKTYNGTWTPNWRNTNEYKWSFYKSFSGGVYFLFCGGWDYLAYHPSGLHLQKQEYGNDIISKFKNIIEDYLMI